MRCESQSIFPSPIRRLVLAAALALAALPAAAAGPKYVLKLATLAPEGSAWMSEFDAIKKDVLAATDGQVVLKAFPGGVLGEEQDVLFKMKVGQVDGAGFMGWGVSRVCPGSAALMLPLQYQDYAEVDAVFAKLEANLEQHCLTNGYVALGWTEIGFSYMYSTKPVRSLADLRQAKPWAVSSSPEMVELFKEGRVSTIAVTVGDVLTALQTGLIQTVYGPPLACVAMQWFTKVKYRNDIRVVYSFGGIFLTRAAWEKLPAELRPKVAEICHRHMRDLTAAVRKSNEDALQVMKSNGIETIVSTPEQVAEFTAIAHESTRRMVGQSIPADLYQLAEQTIAEYHAAHK